ncbi:MAG: hypothetical protein ABSC34_07355 [Acidimicrobiales bacterium]|jgi:hypothetical protein
MAIHDVFFTRVTTKTVDRLSGYLKCRRGCGMVVAIVAASVALAACGGPSSPNVANQGTVTTTTVAASGSGATPTSDPLAFAQCMRSKGVTNYPDPDSSGAIPKESPPQLGVSDARFQSAQNDCKHLLPNGGSGPNQSERQQVTALGLNFAHCMRRHGVPLPDPDGSGRIPDPASVGINQGSPRFESANTACAKYRPPYMPSNAQYNAYARSNGS